MWVEELAGVCGGPDWVEELVVLISGTGAGEEGVVLVAVEVECVLATFVDAGSSIVVLPEVSAWLLVGGSGFIRMDCPVLPLTAYCSPRALSSSRLLSMVVL